MYIIKWRRKLNTTKHYTIEKTITGLSKYATFEAAEKQLSIWSVLFGFNSYYIEPAAK